MTVFSISTFNYDPCREITKLNIPILIVQGNTDIQVGAVDASKLAEANPKARMMMIKGMNHIRSSFAVVAMTLVTLDPWLSRHLEGWTPSPQQRLDAIATLNKAGIPCGVALIPIFPYLTDDDTSLIQVFDGLKTVSPDFVVWQSLWIHEGRHQQQLQVLFASMDGNLMKDISQLYNDDSRNRQPAGRAH